MSGHTLLQLKGDDGEQSAISNSTLDPCRVAVPATMFSVQGLHLGCPGSSRTRCRGAAAEAPNRWALTSAAARRFAVPLVPRTGGRMSLRALAAQRRSTYSTTAVWWASGNLPSFRARRSFRSTASRRWAQGTPALIRSCRPRSPPRPPAGSTRPPRALADRADLLLVVAPEQLAEQEGAPAVPFDLREAPSGAARTGIAGIIHIRLVFRPIAFL